MDSFGMFRLLLDEYSSKIVELTQQKALNAVDLSGMLGIPIAACYRRIRVLRDAGILKEDGRAVSVGGKLVATYRSSVDTAELMLKDGRLKVHISANGRKTSDEVILSDEPPSMLHWSGRKDLKA
jgi:DNA-binding Lrp family transcriptional regulator